MSQKTAVQKLKEIESTYNVDKITYKGISFWPVFRVYIGSQLIFNHDRSMRPTGSVIKKGLRYFLRGLGYWFKKYDQVSFTSSDQRKEIQGKRIERTDFIPKDIGSTLIIETPMPEHENPDKYNTNTASHMFMYVLEFVKIKFYSCKESDFEGLDILNKIQDNYDVKVDHKFLAKRFRAQFSTVQFLNRRWKLKRVFMTTPYTRFGYVYYFKQNNIPVIEFQHGVINKEHNAYNVFINCDDKFYPDYLLTFGERETEVFFESEYVKRSKCFPIGSFYIDHIAHKEMENKIKYKYSGYKSYLAVTLQDMFDDQLLSFLEAVYSELEDHLFVLIPRNKTESDYRKKYSFPKNVVFIPELNTYEIMKMCDIHTTINSTTALEAPSIGTANVLVNIENRSKQYFANILTDEKVNRFANTPQEYITFIRSNEELAPQVIIESNEAVFKSGFEFNLKDSLERIDGDL